MSDTHKLPAQDPAAVFAIAHALFVLLESKAAARGEHQQEDDNQESIWEDHGGQDGALRNFMSTASIFEAWACKHVAFDELADIWPYKLMDSFGEAWKKMAGENYYHRDHPHRNMTHPTPGPGMCYQLARLMELPVFYRENDELIPLLVHVQNLPSKQPDLGMDTVPVTTWRFSTVKVSLQSDGPTLLSRYTVTSAEPKLNEHIELMLEAVTANGSSVVVGYFPTYDDAAKHALSLNPDLELPELPFITHLKPEQN